MSRKKSKRIVDDSGVQLEFLFPEDRPVVEIGPVTGEELIPEIKLELNTENMGSKSEQAAETPQEGLDLSTKKACLRKVEFKLPYKKDLIERIKTRLEIQRRVWNRGLALLEWREWYDKWERVKEVCLDSIASGEVKPVPLHWYLNESSKSKKKKAKKSAADGENRKAEKPWGLYCDRVRFEKGSRELQPGEWRDGDWILVPSIPELVKEHWPGNEPPLPKHGKNSYFSLVSAFAKKRLSCDHYSQHSESAWTKGTLKTLADSWSSYKSGKRDKPRYKKRRDCPSTLIHPNSKEIKISNGQLTLPGLGVVKPKGLIKRWGDRPACPISLTLKGDMVYLQLTGEFEKKAPPKPTGRSIGIDPGVVRLYTDDEGHHVLPPKFLKKSEARLKKLQRKLSRQLRTNSTQVFDENGRCKSIEFREGWNRKNLEKTRKKIAKAHDKIKRQRRAFNHYHSSKLISFADEISIEDTKLTNMVKAVKKGEAGKENGRKRKSGLSRSILDNAIGQFREMIKTKAEWAGRKFRLVPANKTSQRCSNCGHESADNRKTQAHFECVACGYTDNADRNAARNMKQYKEE